VDNLTDSGAVGEVGSPDDVRGGPEARL